MILDIHVMVNWQLSKQGIRWPVSHDHIAGSHIELIEVGFNVEKDPPPPSPPQKKQICEQLDSQS